MRHNCHSDSRSNLKPLDLSIVMPPTYRMDQKLFRDDFFLILLKFLVLFKDLETEKNYPNFHIQTIIQWSFPNSQKPLLDFRVEQLKVIITTSRGHPL